MCGDSRAPSVLIVLRVQPRRPTFLRAVSLPVWSFADWTWRRGWLGYLRAIPLEVPLLSTVIASPSFFTWVPLGIFLRLFKNRFHSHCEGFRLFLCLSLPFFLFFIFPTITDHLSQLYLKTDLVHMPVFVAMADIWSRLSDKSIF